jgi:hypothetical protein
MHTHSIQDSGADSRTKRRTGKTRDKKSAEAPDSGSGRFRDEERVVDANRIAYVVVAVIGLDDNQGGEQRVLSAIGLSLRHIFKGLGAGGVANPINAVKINFFDRILH